MVTSMELLASCKSIVSVQVVCVLGTVPAFLPSPRAWIGGTHHGSTSAPVSLFPILLPVSNCSVQPPRLFLRTCTLGGYLRC